MTVSVHELADVRTDRVGSGTVIGQFAIVGPGAVVGENCRIGVHAVVGSNVVLGDRVEIGSGSCLSEPLVVGDRVVIGANVSLAGAFPSGSTMTEVGADARIEAGATVEGGITIGSHAVVRAGAVITRSVPPNAIVEGNPARIVAYVDTSRPAAPVSSEVGRTPGNSIIRSRVAGVTLHKLPLVADIRGSLTVGEFGQTVPFLPKRYFMVLDVPTLETRGEHAHRACHQFLISVRGQCAVVVDDGSSREEFVLTSPDYGLHLPPMVWGIQYKHSADAVLLVFASEHYDPNDYIRDYGEFLQLVGASH